MYSRWLRSGNKGNVESKFTNNRYLHSLQKDAKLKNLQERAVVGEKERNALHAAVEELTRKNGVNVEPSFHQDLISIMGENQDKIAAQYPEGSFRRLFWEQQIKRSKQGAKQMRWHPTMIRYLMKKILETQHGIVQGHSNVGVLESGCGLICACLLCLGTTCSAGIIC